ncbi:MAG: adenylate/guanylate cyclase domain-containing protein [Alphaproteobacteria bacterium]|nr:adenylate/guanylate cyclase domain-containing protein [Alphaproteobacteria bacterium]
MRYGTDQGGTARRTGGDPGALRRALARVVDYGTQSYPPHVRRRLRVMNIAAACVVVFTSLYTAQQIALDFETWKPVILINLCLISVGIAVPFLHRFGETVGVVTLGIAESVGLFALTACVGREAGLHIQYVAAICVYFAVLGIERLRLILALTGLGVALHLLAWAMFPQERALIAVSRGDLDALYVTAVGTIFTIVAVVIYYAFSLAEKAQAESDALLHNMLPRPIVERLKGAPDALIADEIAEGSVLFADLKGFVPLTKRLGPSRSVALLGTIVGTFDVLADRWRVEKIKTIGDAYMIAAGVSEPTPDHAERLADMALAMLDALRGIAGRHDLELVARIGIATGPVLAGVIGAKRLTYDVWGDTVNLASRLEGLSAPDRILVSRATMQRLEGAFELEPCGLIDIRGLGPEETWYLKGRADLGNRR